MLAGYSDRAQNRGAAAVLGFFAIQYDQVVLRCRTAHLLLEGQNDFLHLTGIDALEQTAKGRLRRSGILALAITPDAKGPALGLAQAPRKLGDVLLPAWSTAEGGTSRTWTWSIIVKLVRRSWAVEEVYSCPR